MSLRLFVAYPADVHSERERLTTVVEDLAPLAQYFGIALDLVDWRKVIPDLGRPEAVILEQLNPSSWDLFIGILWHRFGTPPGGGYKSGTQEEFDLAYRLWSKYKRPSVKLYCCTRDYPPNIDLNQLKLVKKFFKAFSPTGPHPGLYAEFRSTDDFERLVRRHLISFLIDYGNTAAVKDGRLPGNWHQDASSSTKNPERFLEELFGAPEPQATVVYTCRATFTGEKCPAERPIRKALWTHIPVDEIQTFCLTMSSLASPGSQAEEDDIKQAVMCSKMGADVLFGNRDLAPSHMERPLFIIGENNLSNSLLDMMAAYLPWQYYSGAFTQWSRHSGEARPHVFIKLSQRFNLPLVPSQKKEVQRGGGMIALFPNPFNIRQKVLILFGCHQEGQLCLEKWLKSRQCSFVTDSLRNIRGDFVGSWALQIVVNDVWDTSASTEPIRAAAVPNLADNHRLFWFQPLSRATIASVPTVNKECRDPHDMYDLSLLVVLRPDDQRRLRETVEARLQVPQLYWEDQASEVGFHITLFEFCTHRSSDAGLLKQCSAMANRICDSLLKGKRERPTKTHVRLRGLVALPLALITSVDFLNNDGMVTDWLDSARVWCEDNVIHELGGPGDQARLLNEMRVPFPAHVTLCRFDRHLSDDEQASVKRTASDLVSAELLRCAVDKVCVAVAKRTPYRKVEKIVEIELR